MTKHLTLLLFIGLAFWSCEEEIEEDTTPPTLSITSHASGQSVSEIITIIATSEDDDGVSKVEFYLNTSLVETDTTLPYEYTLNTTHYDNDQTLSIKVISYDNSDNTTETQFDLSVDNSTAVPQGVNITSVTYSPTVMTVDWEESSDGDFKDYKVLYSETEDGVRDTIATYTDQSIRSLILTEFDPTHENWFWVKVTDTVGLSSIGIGMTNEIESDPPTPSVLFHITYNDGFKINWSRNNGGDFQSYKLYESLSEDMSNDTLIYETHNRTDTTFIKTVQNFRYYQIVVEDVWGLQSTSNIEVGDYDIQLWGEPYSILNTTSLNLQSHGLTGSISTEIGHLINLEILRLGSNELTGSIPPEIGNLTNLTSLHLQENQFTGSMPTEIGNLTNLTSLHLQENQLTGSMPTEIGNLTNLTYLYLNENQLTGSIPMEIGNLTNLTYLYLNENQLTGSIPMEIGNLTNLERLSLISNQLTGLIPSEIGNLTNLERLILISNQLTGLIPSEIGNLTNLVWLGLSYNQLTGEIPESICDLNVEFSNSGHFLISTNQLCPPYPPCIEDYVGYQDTSDCD
jgi:hypothetical protein